MDKPLEPGRERRKFDRYETDLKIQFYVQFDLETKIDVHVVKEGKVADAHTAVGRNVSAAGLSFLSEKIIPTGEKLILDVWIPSADTPIRMEGEVRWSKPSGEDLPDRKYVTGVKLGLVNGNLVENSIFFDKTHQMTWSIVLESVFGDFKHRALKMKGLRKSD